MRGFFAQLQGRMTAWMQGRYGNDELSQSVIVVALIITVVALFTGWNILSTVGLLLLAYAMFRTFSKNFAARQKELATFQRIAEKPKRAWSHANTRWENRKTTCYFKCKGCGTMLSVPRGKGKLRVVCPKCHTETMRKS